MTHSISFWLTAVKFASHTIFAFVLTIAAVGTVRAADGFAHWPVTGAAPEPLPGAGLKSRDELETFVDGFMGSAFRAHKFVGATVAVVKDGDLFFAKGYGHQDYARKIPVDPAKTLFRPGSVSKLFTWTAVMQLVEEGKLNLDADVNIYLKDFKIPADHAQPITLRNLLTHTPGLEDGALGYLMEDSPDGLVPLGEALKAHMPKRVRQPTTDFADGTGASYSNWGTALAGHIVATVSGMSFDDYADHRVLGPLGMSESTFREPLPERLRGQMAGGYKYKDGEFVRGGFEYIHNFGPAGSLSATATDMAKFMIAHLQNGRYGDARILKEETARLMHSRVFSPDPHANGGGLGFYETYVNGRRTIGHGGATVYFMSELVLVPEASLGYFISFNTPKGALAIQAFKRAFMDRYFPARLPEAKPAIGAEKRMTHYAGTYRTLRLSHTKIDKVLALGGDITVTPMPDQTFLVTDLMEEPSRWVEVAPRVFRKVSDDTVIAFKTDERGEVTHLVGPFSPIAAEKLSWYETSNFHFLILGLGVLLFLSILASVVMRWREDRAAPRYARLLRWTLAGVAVLYLAFLGLAGASITAGIDDLLSEIPAGFKFALTLPLVALVLVIAALVLLALCWRERHWALFGRLYHLAVVVAAVLFLWSLNYWNLLGYRFG